MFASWRVQHQKRSPKWVSLITIFVLFSQFPNMVWWWVTVYMQSVISCLFREQSTLLSLGAGDDLGTVAFGLFREQSKLLSLGAGDDLIGNCCLRGWRWLGNCCLRPKATVPKSSPAPRDNSFDCFMNRHEITVLLSYIHAHNHKSTEDDNVSIPYH